jgi:P-type Cu+ transporter
MRGPRSDTPSGYHGCVADADLELQGMTCAGCAQRIERRLNLVDGARATVNLASERAHVVYDPARAGVDDLVAAVRDAGYQAAPACDEAEDAPAGLDPLARRLLVAVTLSVPVLLISMVRALQFDGWQWVVFALATPVVLWCGWPFHRAALRALRHGQATMDTLISMGSLAAWGWSVIALAVLDAGRRDLRMGVSLTIDRGAASEALYLEVGAAIVTLVLLGRWLEARARRRSGDALRALAALQVREATLIGADGHERPVPVASLTPGDRFVVRPGEGIAVDGVVEDGRSAVDAAVLTGESVPVEVGPGAEVGGGAVNAGGRIVVRATRVGADTALARITRMVERAQAGKAPVQRLADRVSAVFVPVVILLSAATLAGWLIAGGSATAAFGAAVAVLVIACPCAMGLATPTAIMVGTGRGAELGILIRGPEVLESTRRVTAVLLDKTGTLTEGAMRVVEVRAGPGVDGDEALRLAGGAESGSEHPIGKAIAAAARGGGALPRAEDFEATAGLGVRATVAGRRVTVVRAAGPVADEFAAEGRTAVEVLIDGRHAATVALADSVRPTAREAVSRLRGLGLRPVLLTGDREEVARAVGRAVGVDEVVAGVDPEGKARAVAALQGRGDVVAMVGDGVNDGPALALADLGIAVGTGTEVAAGAADLTLVGGDPRGAADAIALSRRTLGTIKANLAWAFGYNAVAIPLAAAGLLNPIIAAAAMAGSSLLVCANSLRLRRFAPPRGA